MESVKTMLNATWNLSFTYKDEKINTQIEIPSNIEPKLKELGLVKDYMPCDYEFATAEFELVDDWTYTLDFDAVPAKDGYDTYLVFEGIDTIAQIYLNDEKLCDCMDMHMTYSFDVAQKLKSKNRLKVVIRSSDLWAREHCHDMYSIAFEKMSYYDSQKYLRKARHQWGWDNAPRLITSGIFRPVYIEQRPKKRFDDVYLYTIAVTDETVRIGANWVYKTDEKSVFGHKIRFTLSDGDKVVFTEDRDVHFIQGAFKITLPRKDVELWWPAGFGQAKVYDLKLEILDGEIVLACHEEKFGIRKITLERTEDVSPEGEGEFLFRVNGEKVYVRGTNWKPLDPLASLADEKTRSLKALETLVDLNCNMVRIWGGGIYEDKAFFHFCDEHGIMVWQDFMFACEIPPTDEWFCRLVAQEANQVIRRYRNHACLAVWCGDNEDDMCLGWMHENSEVMPSEIVISRKILKDAVMHFDPFRPYVESSPYFSERYFTERKQGNILHEPTEVHFYPDVAGYKTYLRQIKSMFMGETGPIPVNAIIANPQIFENERSRMERLWDSPLKYGNSSHQSDGYFTRWRNSGKEMCQTLYGRDFSLDEWKDYMLAINLGCAEMFKEIVEYCRVKRWSKTGVLWWSLCDMWPMLFNYSVMDFELNKKLPYFWIRNSQQELAFMAVSDEVDGDYTLYFTNDTLDSAKAEYIVDAYDVHGNVKRIVQGEWEQSKNFAGAVCEIKNPESPELWIIKWCIDGKWYANHTITQIADYQTAKNWVEIIGRECGFLDSIEEFKFHM